MSVDTACFDIAENAHSYKDKFGVVSELDKLKDYFHYPFVDLANGQGKRTLRDLLGIVRTIAACGWIPRIITRCEEFVDLVESANVLQELAVEGHVGAVVAYLRSTDRIFPDPTNFVNYTRACQLASLNPELHIEVKDKIEERLLQLLRSIEHETFYCSAYFKKSVDPQPVNLAEVRGVIPSLRVVIEESGRLLLRSRKPRPLQVELANPVNPSFSGDIEKALTTLRAVECH